MVTDVCSFYDHSIVPCSESRPGEANGGAGRVHRRYFGGRAAGYIARTPAPICHLYV